MATKKVLKKLLINGVTYNLPTSDDYVDKTSNQTIGGTKTFTTSPVVPSKSTNAGDNATVVATEAQVYKKQDKLTAGANVTIAEVSGVLTISATDTTYSEVTKNDMDTWTSTTAGVVSAKAIAEFVAGKVGSAVNYKGQVQDYASLPANPNTGDMYNVVEAHTTAPKFNAGTNVVWNGTSWDPMAEMIDLSNLVTLTTAQTISGVKTFTVEPVLPSKTTDATNDGTKPATEAQVYKKADPSDIHNVTVTINQGATSSVWSFTTNQSSASSINLQGNVPVTQSAYDNLPSSKTSDGNTYMVYEEVTA